MTEHLESAPEGFAFDQDRLEAAAVEAFREADPDMYRELVAGRVAYFAELDERNVPVMRVSDKATGAALGVLQLDWRDVGRADPK